VKNSRREFFRLNAESPRLLVVAVVDGGDCLRVVDKLTLISPAPGG
jgi:hypothetical protein